MYKASAHRDDECAEYPENEENKKEGPNHRTSPNTLRWINGSGPASFLNQSGTRVPAAAIRRPPTDLSVDKPALARVQIAPQSQTMNEALTDMILAVIGRAPEWIRHDLVAKDAAIRTRAEERLAAMIANALAQENGSA